jgi:hypothetical protein
LTARLQETLALPLTLVCAPEGHGKTTALQAAIATLDTPVVWYAAQSWQSREFFEPLIAACRRVRPDFGGHALALARGQNRIESETAVRRAFARRMGAAFSLDFGRDAGPLTIVIDDADRVGGAEFAEFVRSLLRALPGRARLCLLARTPPAFLNTDAAFIGADELRFGADEAAELAAASGRNVRAAQIEELRAATSGSPALLALALGLPRLPAPAELGSAGAVAALFDDYLNGLSKPLARFLERTAAFDVLERSLLEGYPAFANARLFLDALEKNAAFFCAVVPAQAYEVHRFMRGALLARVRAREGAPGVAGAHVLAAEVCESAGRLGAALDHLERAGDLTRVQRFVRAHLHALCSGPAAERVAALTREGEESGKPDPVLAPYLRGLAAEDRGDPGARGEFMAAAVEAAMCGDAALLFEARFRAADGCRRREVAVGPSEAAAIVALSVRLGPQERARALVLAGRDQALRGDFEAALASAESAAELAAGAPAVLFASATVRASVATARGEIAISRAILGDTLSTFERGERPAFAHEALLWYGRLALLRGETAEALGALRAAEPLLRAIDRGADLALLYAALTEAAAHAGEADAVDGYAAAADAFGAPMRRFRARAAFLRDDFADAESVAGGLLPPADGCSAEGAALLADTMLYARIAGRRDEMLSAATRTALAEAPAPSAHDAVVRETAAALVDALEAFDAREEPVRLRPSPFGGLLAQRRDRALMREAGDALRRHAEGDGPESLVQALERLLESGPRFEIAVFLVLWQELVRSRIDGIAGSRFERRLRERLPRSSGVVRRVLEGSLRRPRAEQLMG